MLRQIPAIDRIGYDPEVLFVISADVLFTGKGDDTYETACFFLSADDTFDAGEGIRDMGAYIELPAFMLLP